VTFAWGSRLEGHDGKKRRIARNVITLHYITRSYMRYWVSVCDRMLKREYEARGSCNDGGKSMP